ncbi:helix-turn-helix domain-containing protein [Leucobacter massiliensis]|uniref:helix-turn-helix domain-containing protein n=1 Tax=Leucobacter massiliensis TaxID=1686285 RepID=UPI0015E3F917|nr:helix-turn-helix domain-containing protein [Leucobacter massiliensis]
MTKHERKPGSLLYWVEWARSRSGLRVAEKAVLLVLATRADKNGECYPGIKLLAQEASLSERAARDATKSLEAAGLILRSSRYRGGEGAGGRRSNVYTLTPTSAASTGNVSAGLEADTAANPLQETAGLEADAAGTVETTSETTNRNNQYEAQPASRSRASEITNRQIAATQAQQNLIQDLYLHNNNQLPSFHEIEQWSRLTVSQASALITNLYRSVNRHGCYEGPEQGTPEYEALSDAGQVAADLGMIPNWTEELAAREGWFG